MTNNKLPEVGTTYRSKLRIKGYDYELIEVMYIKPSSTGTYHILWIDTKKHSTMTGSEYLEDFWDKFEEIPEDKQEKAASASKENVNCNLSDEVVEAMERLEKEFQRKQIFIGEDWVTDNSISPNDKLFISLRISSAKLIQALNNQFGKEPTEETKEKEESIWKPVSELPKYFEETALLNRDEEGNIGICGFYKKNGNEGGLFLGKAEIGEYCTLTDFINHIGDIDKRLRRLESSSTE